MRAEQEQADGMPVNGVESCSRDCRRKGVRICRCLRFRSPVDLIINTPPLSGAVDALAVLLGLEGESVQLRGAAPVLANGDCAVPDPTVHELEREICAAFRPVVYEGAKDGDPLSSTLF